MYLWWSLCTLYLGPFCFTSTEARWPIRDRDRVGRGRKSEGSTADTARKRPERPWTAARTMGVLRRCPLAIAQRLVHCAIAVSTALLGQSHKDNIRCTAVEELYLPLVELTYLVFTRMPGESYRRRLRSFFVVHALRISSAN